MASQTNRPPVRVDQFTKGIVHHNTYPAIDPVTKSDCTGKTVLITGASRGFGRAMAAAYAQAGASKIALAARSDLSGTTAAVRAAAIQADRSNPIDILELQMDVCDTASVKMASEKLNEEWGRLDLLICNAGYLAPFSPLLDMDEDACMRTWDVNYWGTFRCCKYFMPLMLKGGDKTIVTLSSVSAHFVGTGGSAYFISKCALMRLTEFIHEEYRSQGILAYSVHPGGTATTLSSNLPEKFKCKLRHYPLLDDLLISKRGQIARMTDTLELGGHTIPFLTSKRRDWLGGRWVSSMWDMPTLLSMEKEIVDNDLLKMKFAL